MHSSRMLTGRSLTICRSLLPRGGCLLLGEGAVWSRWVSALGGSAPRWGVCLGGICSGGCLVQGGVSGPRGVSGPGQGVCSGGCLVPGGQLLGVSASGGCLVPGDLFLGGVWSRGVSTLGGVWSQGGVWSLGSAPGGCWGDVSAPQGGGYPSMH